MRIDAVTARAVRLALWSTEDAEAVARQVLAAAEGNPLVLAGALARVRRSCSGDPSAVAARTEAALHAAYALATGG